MKKLEQVAGSCIAPGARQPPRGPLLVESGLQQRQHGLARPRRWPLFSAAILIGVGLVTLWWIDPAEVRVPMCMFHLMTGLHCPGCGATRATHELLHGRLGSALHHNALWMALLPALFYAGASELRRFLRGRPLWGNLGQNWWFLAVVVVSALAFFLLRNLPAYPFVLLTPPG